MLAELHTRCARRSPTSLSLEGFANGSVRRRNSAMASSLDTGLLPRVEPTSLLEDLRIHLADPGVLVYVLLLGVWVVRLAVRGRCTGTA
jgi:hypothetical protein